MILAEKHQKRLYYHQFKLKNSNILLVKKDNLLIKEELCLLFLGKIFIKTNKGT